MAYINGKEILFSPTIKSKTNSKLVRLNAPNTKMTASSVTEYPLGVAYRSNDFSPTGMGAYIDSKDKDEVFFAITEATATPVGLTIDYSKSEMIEVLQLVYFQTYEDLYLRIYISDDGETFTYHDGFVLKGESSGDVEIQRVKINTKTRCIRILQESSWTKYRFVLKGIETFGEVNSGSYDIVKNGTVEEGVSIEEIKVCRKPFINTAEITNFSYFFYENARLNLLDKVDFSKMNSCGHIFEKCSNLTEEPLFTVTGKYVDSCGFMFTNCTNLKSIKKNNFRNFGMMSTAFQGCTSLEEVDTQIFGYNYAALFSGCIALKKVATVDCNKVLSNGNMFYNCKNLTELTLTNIKKSIQIGSGETWGHLLTVDSLINTVKELVNTGSTLTLTMGSVNKEKIADIWCVVTDDTTEKMTIEIVDAGTEGAITLEDFAGLKNWTIV